MRMLKQFEGTGDDSQVQFGPVFEVHIEQGARETGFARQLVHGQAVPARAGIQALGGLDDFEAAALFFLFTAFGKVRHGTRVPCR